MAWSVSAYPSVMLMSQGAFPLVFFRTFGNRAFALSFGGFWLDHEWWFGSWWCVGVSCLAGAVVGFRLSNGDRGFPRRLIGLPLALWLYAAWIMAAYRSWAVPLTAAALV